MIAGHVRALAICILRNRDRLFVAEYNGPVKGETFYRPLGGAIEFGEKSQETIVREAREEINAEVINLRYLGVVENLFTYKGEKGHEIILVYEGDFADWSLYGLDALTGREDDGTPLRAVWKSLDDFQQGHAPLYPNGLLDLLGRIEQT